MDQYIYLLIGICIGIILYHLYLFITCKIVGTLNINIGEKKDTYVFNVDVPLEKLTNYKVVRLKIAYNTPPNMSN